jgi:hypothetical protein
MDRMMKRIRKAFIMGTIDEVSADTIFLSARIRPKSRITRKARMKRSTVTGMLAAPSATSDMTTTRVSSRLQGLHRKGCGGPPERRFTSGAMRAGRDHSLAGAGAPDLQPVRVHVDGQLGCKDGGEDEVGGVERAP